MEGGKCGDEHRRSFVLASKEFLFGFCGLGKHWKQKLVK